MSEFLTQGLDVNAILVPPCGVHPEGMARLFRFLDRVAYLVCFFDDAADDPIQVLVHCSGYRRGENQNTSVALPRYFLRQARSVSLTTMERSS